jgi:endonuclease-3
MDTGGFDTYPILHHNRIYNVITRMELTFREVRAMLDWLIAEGAFPAEGGEREPEGLYSCPVEGLLFDVDVQGYEVVVYRRKALEDAGTTGRKGVAPAGELLAFLAREYPEARVLLEHRNPFELLVATVLAAQCTDERVNRVTPGLFRALPGPADFAKASQAEVEELVRPTGFYRNKAKAVRELSAAIVRRHGGVVPATMEELTALPGVGRKTASVLLGACFGVPALPVDTHVGRVSFRLGLTGSKDPLRIEEDLARAIPSERWWEFATRLGWHGRKTCAARKPACEECGLEPECPKRGLVG